MKGYSSGAPPSKRRWKGQATTVLALVFFSLLVPLAFLLGVHNRFPSGYFNDDPSPSESSFSFEREDGGDRERLFELDHRSMVDTIVRKFGPNFSEDIAENNTREEDQNLHLKSDHAYTNVGGQATPEQMGTVSDQEDIASQPEVLPTVQSHGTLSEPPPGPNISKGGFSSSTNPADVSAVDEAKKHCQFQFGGYCLWSIQHKEVMTDSVVKRLKDQVFVARAYYPSMAKLQGQEQLSHELKQNIQEHERILSDAVSDADLPSLIGDKIEKMDQTIARARACPVDCSNIDKKLRQILDLTEDEAYFHMKQSAFLYHLGVQTIPKSLHCLSMRLTVEYFEYPSEDVDFASHKIQNPKLRHYVMFSRNLLSSSVAINSTVMNSEETENMIFHLLTDTENYYAMKFWFARNSYRKAAVHVQNFDKLYSINDPDNLGSQLTLSEEFRVSILNTEQQSPGETRTEYISLFGHSHFLLPDIFKNLNKVIVLDDDVVVQKDLSSLWDLDLHGKVIGAVEFCGVRFGQLKTYLDGRQYDTNSCAWMSGMNVIDLDSWRHNNVTGVYQQLTGAYPQPNHQLWSMSEEASWRATALPASLLAFENRVYPLDRSWALSGLGHDYGLTKSELQDAQVLHYNGDMKPWLDLGIPKYKWYWKKYLTQDDRFMEQCNVNP